MGFKLGVVRDVRQFGEFLCSQGLFLMIWKLHLKCCPKYILWPDMRTVPINSLISSIRRIKKLSNREKKFLIVIPTSRSSNNKKKLIIIRNGFLITTASDFSAQHIRDINLSHNNHHNHRLYCFIPRTLTENYFPSITSHANLRQIHSARGREQTVNQEIPTSE